jgi:molybdopterin/thiamine biosynthesis adenylyltransferase
MDYSRQELVIGKKAQKKLEKSKVVIIGVGALGSLTSELLVRSGVKNLVLYDRDFVELSNLQRQHLFNLKDVGKPKVKAAKKYLSSAVQEKGYVFSGCYSCIFSGLKSIDNCETLGVLNSITSLISSLQVSEAMKILIGKKVDNDLIYINLNKNEFSKIEVKKKKDCKTCSKKYVYLAGREDNFCGN